MKSSQYKNIIQGTLANHSKDSSSGTPLAVVKAIFDNCGVAFPSGSNTDILLTLLSDDYMGWRSCTAAKAQYYANKGVAAIGVDAHRIVVIT